MTWLAQWLNSTVTVRNAAFTLDRFGAEVLDWANPDDTECPGYVQERSSVEQTIGDQRNVVSAVAFLPVDAPVLSTSRIVDVGSVVWDVDSIKVCRFAGRSHLEVKISRELVT